LLYLEAFVVPRQSRGDLHQANVLSFHINISDETLITDLVPINDHPLAIG
jgi:hypothetical protein